MKCRACGAEIADKALICYRCGASTFEPPPREASERRRRRAGLLPSVAALVVLIVAALFMSRAAIGETPRLLGWIVVALAAVVVVWRIARRR
jgi:hypothetical protein